MQANPMYAPSLVSAHPVPPGPVEVWGEPLPLPQGHVANQLYGSVALGAPGLLVVDSPDDHYA